MDIQRFGSCSASNCFNILKTTCSRFSNSKYSLHYKGDGSIADISSCPPDMDFDQSCAGLYRTISSRKGVNFLVRSQRVASSEDAISREAPGRRQLLAMGIAVAPFIVSSSQALPSFAAESKKGFLPVTDKKDGYSFIYPFGWQEVVIEGQDKVFKDVIEPLENVSVTVIPTAKVDIKDFGQPNEVAETLIKKVLAPPSQKTKLIAASERDIEGKTYYTFEFVAKAPNYTRHALSTVCIGNGKFYTLTTGANERRWDKMKERLQTVTESFEIFTVRDT